jgi:hypothetical protein
MVPDSYTAGQTAQPPADDPRAIEALLPYLLALTPYGTPRAVDATEAPITAAGPAAENSPDRPLRRTLDDLTPREVFALLRWRFGGEEYSISKAIRVPYEYQRADGTWRRVAVLIGFQGPEFS